MSQPRHDRAGRGGKNNGKYYYICDECARKCKTVGGLTIHRKKHTIALAAMGHRPLKCREGCTANFNSEYWREEHELKFHPKKEAFWG